MSAGILGNASSSDDSDSIKTKLFMAYGECLSFVNVPIYDCIRLHNDSPSAPPPHFCHCSGLEWNAYSVLGVGSGQNSIQTTGQSHHGLLPIAPDCQCHDLKQASGHYVPLCWGCDVNR